MTDYLNRMQMALPMFRWFTYTECNELGFHGIRARICLYILYENKQLQVRFVGGPTHVHTINIECVDDAIDGNEDEFDLVLAEHYEYFLSRRIPRRKKDWRRYLVPATNGKLTPVSIR